MKDADLLKTIKTFEPGKTIDGMLKENVAMFKSGKVDKECYMPYNPSSFRDATSEAGSAHYKFLSNIIDYKKALRSIDDPRHQKMTVIREYIGMIYTLLPIVALAVRYFTK